jgi:hypothetical protein
VNVSSNEVAAEHGSNSTTKGPKQVLTTVALQNSKRPEMNVRKKHVQYVLLLAESKRLRKQRKVNKRLEIDSRLN